MQTEHNETMKTKIITLLTLTSLAGMALAAKYEDVGALTGEAVLDVLNGAGREQYFVKEPQLFLNRANLSLLGLSIPEPVRAKAKKIY